jgi:hypothetical protein
LETGANVAGNAGFGNRRSWRFETTRAFRVVKAQGSVTQGQGYLDTGYVRAIFICMKNVTFSAEEVLIQKARSVARQRATSLNELFRAWLRDLTRQSGQTQNYDRLMERLDSRRSGRAFSREEMNER